MHSNGTGLDDNHWHSSLWSRQERFQGSLSIYRCQWMSWNLVLRLCVAVTLNSSKVFLLSHWVKIHIFISSNSERKFHFNISSCSCPVVLLPCMTVKVSIGHQNKVHVYFALQDSKCSWSIQNIIAKLSRNVPVQYLGLLCKSFIVLNKTYTSNMDISQIIWINYSASLQWIKSQLVKSQ